MPDYLILLNHTHRLPEGFEDTITLVEAKNVNGETYRVEESISRVLASYGLEAEVFAIPNCLTVSIETADGRPMTRMRRIGFHGNDLDTVEKYSNLSRRICTETPDPATAKLWLKDTDASLRSYSLPVTLLGNFMGAMGFAIVFGFVSSHKAGNGYGYSG